MRDKIFLGLLLIFSIVLHRGWFFDYSVNTHADWGYFTLESQRALFSLPHIWNSTHQGYVDLGLSFYPINVLWGGLGYVTNFAISERILYFFPSVIVCVISSYFLIRKVSNSPHGALFGSLVFSYNTYFLNARLGHLTLMMAFALAPLFLLLFILTLERRSYWYALLAGLTASLLSFYEFRGFYVVGWIVIFYFIYFSFFLIDRKNFFRQIVRYSSFLFLVFGIVILTNFYWLYGYTSLGTLSSNAIFNRDLFGSEFLLFSNSITLSHPFWTGTEPTAFVRQSIPFYRWFLPVFALCGLFFARKNKYSVFFGFVSLLGILLAKQDNTPFPGIYMWLYASFPGFNAFREASKFFFIVALGYSALIGFLISWLWEETKLKSILILRWIVPIIIIMIVLVDSRGFFTQEVKTLITPRTIPRDYVLTNTFIQSQDSYFKTLWVPLNPRWSTSTQFHPRNDTHWLIYNSLSSFVAEKRFNSSLEDDSLMLYLLQHPYFDRIIDILSVKYVMVPLADKANDDNLFSFYETERSEFVKALDTLSFLRRKDIGTDEVIVFENEGYRSKVYLTSELDTYTQSNMFINIYPRFISPDHYDFELTNISKPIYINFSEAFHPDWSLRAGSFSYLSQLYDAQYFLPQDFHYATDLNTNAFYIDPEFIKAKLDKRLYSINPDGSLNFSATLYFKTQDNIYLGLILMCGIALLSIVTVILFRRSRWKSSL